MLIYNTAFSIDDMDYLRENKLGLEVFHYAQPDFLDDFDNSKQKVAEYMQGMKGVSMHGAYMDLSYTSADRLICDVTKKRFLQIIEAAKFHSVKNIVFHSSYKRAYDNKDTYLERATEFWSEFEKNIPGDITIYIENIEDNDPEVFVKLIKNINNKNIRCCFDIGHAHCNSDVPVNTWIDTLGDLICHVHLHDNNGTGDEHLPLGKGNILLVDAINKLIKLDVPFVLECNIKESLKWLKDFGFYV